MTIEERAKTVVDEEAVENGVCEGFIGVVAPDFVEQEIENTVEMAGATAEANDLAYDIEHLNKRIKRAKIMAIGVWVLAAVTFMARFLM